MFAHAFAYQQSKIQLIHVAAKDQLTRTFFFIHGVHNIMQQKLAAGGLYAKPYLHDTINTRTLFLPMYMYKEQIY